MIDQPESIRDKVIRTGLVPEEFNYGRIISAQLLVFLVSSGIMDGAAVEYKSSAILRQIYRYSPLVREAVYLHY